MEANDLGKYQLILDKQLLGSVQVAPRPVPQREAQPAPPSWAQEYRMTMMTLDEDQVRIGLQHVQNQSAFLLIEGEDSHSEFTLISANYEQGSAVVRHRDIDHRFDLQTGPVVSVREERGEPPVTTTVRGRARRIIRPPGPRPFPESSENNEPGISMERRFESSEELEAHLKEQQLDAIRSGKPPLPIPLTEEMDDQLVREGVLPPRGE
ncbi:MAG: hypothetical protein WD708_04485 [Kiritimatiellia bacterium]